MWQVFAVMWVTGCPPCRLGSRSELHSMPMLKHSSDPTGWGCSFPYKHLCWGHSRGHYQTRCRALRSPDAVGGAWRVGAHMPEPLVRNRRSHFGALIAAAMRAKHCTLTFIGGSLSLDTFTAALGELLSLPRFELLNCSGA